MRINQTSHLKQFLLALSLACVVAPAYCWQQDWQLDTEMDVLDQPVRRPIIIPLGDGLQRGAPNWSIYKQQPAAAQGDFRVRPPVIDDKPAGNPVLPGNGGGKPEAPGIPENPAPPTEKPDEKPKPLPAPPPPITHLP